MQKSIVRILTIGLFFFAVCSNLFLQERRPYWQRPAGTARTRNPIPPPKTLKEIYQHGRIQKVPYSEKM